MPGANGPRFGELLPDAVASLSAEGPAHSKTLREFRCPFNSAPRFGVRSRNCNTVLNSLPRAWKRLDAEQASSRAGNPLTIRE
jgi:hypothetical protein